MVTIIDPARFAAKSLSEIPELNELQRVKAVSPDSQVKVSPMRRC